jgi:hypothetical protein
MFHVAAVFNKRPCSLTYKLLQLCQELSCSVSQFSGPTALSHLRPVSCAQDIERPVFSTLTPLNVLFSRNLNFLLVPLCRDLLMHVTL